jgi:hypothetical protein
MFVDLLRIIYSTLRIFEIEEHWQEEIRKGQQCLRLCTVPVPHSNILPVHLWTIDPLVKFHWSSTGTRGRQLQYSRSENECQKKIQKDECQTVTVGITWMHLWTIDPLVKFHPSILVYTPYKRYILAQSSISYSGFRRCVEFPLSGYTVTVPFRQRFLWGSAVACYFWIEARRGTSAHVPLVSRGRTYRINLGCTAWPRPINARAMHELTLGRRSSRSSTCSIVASTRGRHAQLLFCCTVPWMKQTKIVIAETVKADVFSLATRFHYHLSQQFPTNGLPPTV